MIFREEVGVVKGGQLVFESDWRMGVHHAAPLAVMHSSCSTSLRPYYPRPPTKQ